MLELRWKEDGEKVGCGRGVDVLDCGHISKCEVHRHESQSECEETKEAAKTYCHHPVDVAHSAADLLGFGNEDCHHNKHVCRVNRGICRELHKEFMAVLTHHSTDPGTKVVHLQTASANITAVMAAIRLPIRTRLAPQRKSVGVALKHVLGIVFLDARRRRHTTLQYTLMVQPDRFLVVGYGRASA